MSRPEPRSQPERQRLLEGWLPLAQDANAQFGWGLDAAALEALILSAAPALHEAHTALQARAMLWGSYQRLHREHEQ